MAAARRIRGECVVTPLQVIDRPPCIVFPALMDTISCTPMEKEEYAFSHSSALQVAELGRTLALALQRDVHACGVIHLDIKPDNILLTPWRIKLIRLGQAPLVDNRYLRAARMAYMSPHRRYGQKSGPCRLDVFSLGLTLL